MFYCVNDRYDPDGSISFDNLGQFIGMCQDCFGETPDLIEQADGNFTDLHGDIVLEFREGEGDDGGFCRSGNPLCG